MTFENFLETVNITDSEKQILTTFRNSIENPGNTCRKIFIHGCAGIGKTMLIKNLLSDTAIPVIYWGIEPEDKYISCKTSSELLEAVKEHENCVVFMDNAMLMMKDPATIWDLDKEDEKRLYEILNIVNESKQRSIVLISDDILHAVGIMDRMNVKIKLDLPSIKSKTNFIDQIAHDLPEKLVDYLSFS